MKWILFVLMLGFSIVLLAQEAPTNITLSGQIIDSDTKDALPFVEVTIHQDSLQITGAMTDYDGNFIIPHVPNTGCTLRLTFFGHQSKTIPIQGNLVSSPPFLWLEMEEDDRFEHSGCHFGYAIPLIDFQNTSSGSILDSEDMKKVAGRN